MNHIFFQDQEVQQLPEILDKYQHGSGFACIMPIHRGLIKG